MARKIVGHLSPEEKLEMRDLVIAEDMLFIGEECVDPREYAEHFQAFWEWLFVVNDLDPGKEYVICRYTGTIFEEEEEGWGYEPDDE